MQAEEEMSARHAMPTDRDEHACEPGVRNGRAYVQQASYPRLTCQIPSARVKIETGCTHMLPDYRPAQPRNPPATRTTKTCNPRLLSAPAHTWIMKLRMHLWNLVSE